jgi:magnesium transporter
MQSVTLTLQSLHVARPTLRWFRAAMSREGHAIAGLSLACAAVVALVVLVWRGAGAAVAVIAAGAAGAVAMACVVGVTVPAVLHRLRLDLRLAAGPIALAVADVFTVVWYLGLAARWL